LKKYLLIFVFIAGMSKAAVGPFSNLGFDETNTNHVFDLNGDNTYFYGPIGELLPGWQLSSGTNAFAPSDLIGFNLSLPGPGYATLYSTNGNFSLGLWPGVDFSTLAAVPYSLTQSGSVPADARTIHFFNFGLPLELRVNGTVVPLFYSNAQSTVPPIAIGSADVSADVSVFAGQTVELRFTTPPQSSFLSGLDSISFSPQTIPEPATGFLLGLGGLFLVCQRICRRFKKSKASED
jgi:PEP-CTERM motif-containing protein